MLTCNVVLLAFFSYLVLNVADSTTENIITHFPKVSECISINPFFLLLNNS